MPTPAGAVVVDTETTGLNPHEDRVIEVAAARLDDGEVLLSTLVWTDVPITDGATDVHGIRQHDLEGAPIFADIAPRLAEIISSATALVGYNPFYERSFLSQEFQRVGVRVRWPLLICAKRLWDKHEPDRRTLSHAHVRFVGSEHDASHRARGDVLATRAVLLRQLEEFGLHQVDWDALDPEQARWVGDSHHLIRGQDGGIVVNFGKHEGERLATASRDVGYWKWMLSKDFPTHVLQLAYQVVNFRRVGEDAERWVEENLA